MKHTFQKSELATLCLVLVMLVLTAPSSGLATGTWAFASQSAGQVLRVPNGYGSIQSAVDAAAEGAIIQVEAGVYYENVVVTTPGLRLHGTFGAVLDGASVGGIGIHVLGTAAEPVVGVEISGFEVRNFKRGIVLERTLSGRVHHNDVHSNMRPAVADTLDGRGILLIQTRLAEVAANDAHHNGHSGITVYTGSSENLVRANRVVENGSQMPNYGGFGLVVTGAGSHYNQILENEAIGNYGRGIMVTRPSGTEPLTGNLVAQNRSHYNWRSGISTGPPTYDNVIVQNDARWNNLSGLPPCYRCNLMEMSNVGVNVWERNLGTFNLTDACIP